MDAIRRDFSPPALAAAVEANLAAMAIFAADVGSAQTYYGAVRGHVRDLQGGIPGAHITLVNDETAAARSTVANGTGEYLFANVVPGTFALTCGTIEENLANNRATREALHRQAYDARLIENRDGHNWVGWRDTFDPYLSELLARMWT